MDEQNEDKQLSHDLYDAMCNLNIKIQNAHPTSRFHILLKDPKKEKNGCKILKKLMKKERLPGFVYFCSIGRQDLTVEELILKEFRNRVDAEIVEKCEKRIIDCDEIFKEQ